ncbi:MAG: hypothetical protein Q8R47_02410 [Nanoarchaeota archaeon]|nr:hypothetical protein [Nanoarchaeota archaeon]
MDNNDPDDDYLPIRKKRHLYLAVDNDPEYHERPGVKGLEEQKEKEVKKSVSTKKKEKENKGSKGKVILTEEEHQEYIDTINNSKSKIARYQYGILGALTMGMLAGFYFRPTLQEDMPENKPAEIVPLYKDLNHDGIPDAYVKLQNGHKVPMYGMRNGSGNSIRYVTAEEMKKRGNIDDYDALEYRLNYPPENSRYF